MPVVALDAVVAESIDLRQARAVRRVAAGVDAPVLAYACRRAAVRPAVDRRDQIGMATGSRHTSRTVEPRSAPATGATGPTLPDDRRRARRTSRALGGARRLGGNPGGARPPILIAYRGVTTAGELRHWSFKDLME